jgi:membrane protease YdiL (CAAX protease family)
VTYFSGPPTPPPAPVPAPVSAGPDPLPALDPVPADAPLEAGVLPPPAAPVPRWKTTAFWWAAFQTLLVCGIPTNVGIMLVLILVVGMAPCEGGDLTCSNGKFSLEFFATLSLFDTALVALLIRVFLIVSGEHSRDVFLGRRPVIREALLGLALVLPVLIAVTLIVLGIRTIAPWMQTVQQSPMEAFMRTPFDAAIFLVVVVLAGGIREELQRAFILHRFRQHLGGIRLGLVVFSGMFGLLHIDQGLDVAAAIGLLGLFWGVLYATRRSAIMPMVNHAGFNAAQVLQQMVLRTFGQ